MPALHLSPVQWGTSLFGVVLCPPMRLIKVMTSAPTTSEHVIDIINKYRVSELQQLGSYIKIKTNISIAKTISKFISIGTMLKSDLAEDIHVFF